MSDTEFPKVNLPGQWRWVDKHFISDARQVKLQKRYLGFIWITEFNELYHPCVAYGGNASDAARKCLQKARNSTNMYKKEVHPA